ncbi:MAG TPA: insulinase family protein [Planctomycetes bacterium]|nr:insulinase family protein [Planctomycetota bacterium]
MTRSFSSEVAGFDTRESAPGATLHIRRELRRKTSSLRVSWISDLGDGAAIRCLAPACLLRGSESHPSLREISRRSEELWGLVLSASVDRAGQRHIISLRAEFPEDSRLPGDAKVLGDAVDFIREVIHQPLLSDGLFCSQTVSTEVAQHRRTIEGRFDDKRSWAMQRCVEETCSGEPWRYHEYGTIDELELATPQSVTTAWRQSIEKHPMYVHFSGEVDPDEVAAVLLPLTAGRDRDVTALAPRHPRRGAGQLREVEEQFEGNQANLVISLRTNTGHGDPLHEAMMIANGILGGFSHSRLFTQVREKQSLCYSINSHIDGSAGLMLVSAGIDGDAASRTRESIFEQIDVVKMGGFTDEEFQMTIDSWDSRLRMATDSPAAMAEFDLVSRLVGRDPDIDQLRHRVAQVTREAVVEAAGYLQPDLVYLLAPRQGTDPDEEAS